MNAPLRISRPLNVTRPGDPDTRIGTVLSKNLRLLDYSDVSSFELTDQNLSTASINHDFFERRIRREFARLGESPNNPLVLNRIGSIYLANNKPDKARLYFQKALQHKPNYLEAARNLARTYMLKGKPDKADAVLNFVIDDTKSLSVLHDAAILKLILGKYKEALDVIDRMDKSQAGYHEALNTKGLIHLIRKDLPKAEQYFKESIELNASYPSAHNNLAIVHKANNRFKLAVEEFQHALTLDPNYVEAYGNLFQAYVDRKELEAAEEAIDKAQFLAEVEPELAFKHAWIAMTRGKYKDAIERYNAFLSIRPNNGNALNNIGFCYAQLDEYNDALSAYQEACKYVIGHHLPHRNLMNMLTELGFHKRALQIARQLRKIYGDDPMVVTSIGAAYANEENWDEAEDLLQKAYQKKPVVPHLYILLGFFYADIKPDYKKGKEVLNYPLNHHFPKQKDIYNNLIHLHLVNNKVSEAKKLIEHLDLNNSITLATYALFLLKGEKLQQALKTFDKAIKNAPSDDLRDKIKQRKFFDLGNYYLDKSDKKAANENFRIARSFKKGFKYINNQIIDLETR